MTTWFLSSSWVLSTSKYPTFYQWTNQNFIQNLTDSSHLHDYHLVHNNNASCRVIAIAFWIAFDLCILWKYGSYCFILLLRILALMVHEVWSYISCHFIFYFSPPPPCSLCSGLTVFPCCSQDTPDSEHVPTAELWTHTLWVWDAPL